MPLEPDHLVIKVAPKIVVHVDMKGKERQFPDSEPVHEAGNCAPNQRGCTAAENQPPDYVQECNNLAELPNGMSRKVEKGALHVAFVQHKAFTREIIFHLPERLTEVFHVVISNMGIRWKNPVVQA
jgi:hypothetical protein